MIGVLEQGVCLTMNVSKYQSQLYLWHDMAWLRCEPPEVDQDQRCLRRPTERTGREDGARDLPPAVGPGGCPGGIHSARDRGG